MKTSAPQFDPLVDNPWYPEVIKYHPEVDVLFKCRSRLPGAPVINHINPIGHVIVEMNARELVDGPDFPEARPAMARLRGEGLSEHACHWAIGQLTTSEVYGATQIDDAYNEQLRRRLGLLSSQPLKFPARNELCPCGSELKAKKCCLPVFHAFRAVPGGGELDLGVGKYVLTRRPKTSSSDHIVLNRMENRAHISDYLARVGLVDEALQSLEENLAEAESLGNDAAMENALMDLVDLCLNIESFAATGVKYCRRYLQLAEGETAAPHSRYTFQCDLAELLGRVHGSAVALTELDQLIAAHPDTGFFQYRKALYLLGLGHRQAAEELLRTITGAAGDEWGPEVAEWARETLVAEFGHRPGSQPPTPGFRLLKE
jgi:hypothetical protein